MQRLPIRKNVDPGYEFTSVAAPHHQGIRSTSLGRPHFLPEPGRTACGVRTEQPIRTAQRYVCVGV